MAYKKRIKTREEKRREAEKELHYHEEVGKLPEEQARKLVHETRLAEKAQVKKDDDSVKNYLDGKNIFTYLRALADDGQKRLEALDLGEGWKADCIPTDGRRIVVYGKGFDTKQGLQVVLKTPSGNVFMRGMLVTGDPEIDVGAIKTLMEQVENTADNEKGLLLNGRGEKRTKGGIIIP